MIAAMLSLASACAADPVARKPAVPGVTVRLEATALGSGRIGLAFLVDADAARDVSVIAPTLPRDLRAWVGDQPVRVEEPPFDLPSTRSTVHLEPGRTARVPCPVVLVVAASASGNDPFTWTIVLPSPPAALELAASLAIDGSPVAAPRVAVRP